MINIFRLRIHETGLGITCVFVKILFLSFHWHIGGVEEDKRIMPRQRLRSFYVFGKLIPLNYYSY